jgi:plastocyanin
LHTTTSHGVWDSGILQKGQSFSCTFNTPGTYEYLCSVHPIQMRGTVIVRP